MAHKTSKSYNSLQKRLELSPQGAPASEALFKILEILFTEKEAKLVSVLPLSFFTVDKAAKIWKKSKEETTQILNDLADKGILFDSDGTKGQNYIITPTMAGFFEFSIMRTDGKFDRKVLSELYYQYINQEDEFTKQVLGLDPSIARTLVHEDMLPKDEQLVILDYEKASHIINTATCITMGTCYCRHKMEHMGKACDNPQDVCLTFNGAAESLSKHGIAKKISKEEAHKILKKCIELGLVQIGDNVQDGVGWICNCCGCCCEALLAYKKLGTMPELNSNFVAQFEPQNCTNCGICVTKCPVDAIKFENKVIKIDHEKCIGCGVCARFCAVKSITMQRREKTRFTPKDSFERMVVSAINTNKLQNFIFDNRDIWTYSLLRRLFKTILQLKPIKKRLADQQLRSRYLNSLAKAYYKLNKNITQDKKKDYSHPELKN